MEGELFEGGDQPVVVLGAAPEEVQRDVAAGWLRFRCRHCSEGFGLLIDHCLLLR